MIDADNYKLCKDCRPRKKEDGSDNYVISCEKCGEFQVVRSFKISNLPESDKEILSTVLKYLWVMGKESEMYWLNRDKSHELIKAYKSLNTKDRLNMFIKFLGYNTKQGDFFTLTDRTTFIALTTNTKALLLLRDELIERKLIEAKGNLKNRVQLTARGWMTFEEFSLPPKEPIGFIRPKS